jgi:hypothetical protein
MKRSAAFLAVVCDPSARRSALTLQESGKTGFSGHGFVRESPPDETGVIPRYIGDEALP